MYGRKGLYFARYIYAVMKRLCRMLVAASAIACQSGGNALQQATEPTTDRENGASTTIIYVV